MTNKWYQKHIRDPFVKRAKKEGVRSRASYKLIEIQNKRRLIKKGDVVVDLGSAPGAWSEALLSMVGKGKVLACDLLPMEKIEGVSFVQGDFLDKVTQSQIVEQVEYIDVIVSDMAPNLTGNATLDQANMLELLEMVMVFAQDNLKQGGKVLCKGFHGEMFENMLALFKSHFKLVKVHKPEASKSGSKEIYFIGEGFGV